MTDCGYFKTYESGQSDKAPECKWDITKVVLGGGEILCKTVDPAGTSLCTKLDVGGMQVSPAALAASVAAWWLLWRLFSKGGR